MSLKTKKKNELNHCKYGIVISEIKDLNKCLTEQKEKQTVTKTRYARGYIILIYIYSTRL